jgi:HEAT repeat protein
MADAMAKKLRELIDPDRPAELRGAAALVLGEIGVSDADTSRVLCQALDDPEADVRRCAIDAVGKLKIQDALPTLLARVEKGGDEASRAAEVAAKLGARGARALQEMMHKLAPGQRRYIAAALGSAGNASADAAAVEFLRDKDPGVVESAVRSLIRQVPALTAAKKHSLAEQLLALLKHGKSGLPAASESAALRLLAVVGDAAAEPVFWDYALPPHAADIRAAALQALGGRGVAPNKERMHRLFTNALESDFRLAAPALLMLQQQSATTKTLGDWLTLFGASDVGVRRMVLEKVADFDTDELAETLLGQIGHPDRAYREAVLARLTGSPRGQKLLQTALVDAETAEAAWSLARILAPFAKDFDAALRDKLFAKACVFHEASDRRAEPFFFFLREADAGALRDRLEARALAARKKKDYETALGYLKMLARDPSIGFSIRLELACCGLKASNKELASDARANDPTLGQFAHLVQGYAAELIAALEKNKWLEAEDVHYVGFHFIEKAGSARKFGEDVLKMVVRRWPKAKIAKDAKTKLKAAGA